MMKSSRLSVIAAACACIAAVPVALDAQTTGSNSANTKLTQKFWDEWRTGLEAYEAGETALLAGRNEEAADNYKRALQAFQNIRKNNPNWNKNVINYRISLADRRLKTALRRMDYQTAQARGAIDAEKALSEQKSANDRIAELQTSLAESERINADLRRAAEQGKLASQQVAGLLRDKKDLDAKYAALLLQYNELKKSADSATEGSTALEKSLRAEQRRSEALMKVVDDLREENRKFQKALEEAKDTLAENQKKLDKNTEELAAAEKTAELLDDMQKKYAARDKELNDAINELKRNLKETEEKLAAKTKECDTFRQGKDTAVKKLAEETDRIRKESDNLKKEIAELKKEMMAKDAKLIAASDKEVNQNSMIASLNQKNKDLTKQTENLNSKLAEQATAAENSRKQLATLTAENQKLQNELKLLADRVNKLPVDTASGEAEKLKAAMEIKKLTAENDAQKNEIASLKPLAESMKKELDSVKKELDAVKKELAAEKAKPAPAPETIIVKQVDKNAEAKIKDLEAQLAELKKQPVAADQTDALAKKDAEIRKLQAEITALKNAPAPAPVADPAQTAKIAELEKSKKELMTSLQTVTDEKNRLAELNKKNQKDLLNTQALLEKAKLEAMDDTELRAAEKARDEWKRKQETTEQSRIALETKLKEQQTAAQKLNDNVKALEKTRDDLTKKLQRITTELDSWKKGQNTVSAAEMKKQTQALDAIAKDLKERNDECAALKAKLKTAETDAARYQYHLQQARIVTEKAMEESRKLRAQLLVYRRNDPSPAPEVPQAKGLSPEIIALTKAPDGTKETAEAAAGDLARFNELMEKGKAAEAKKDYDDALIQYWAAADVGVNKPEPYIAVARIHAMRNNPEQGLRTYERALRMGAKRIPELENILKKQLIESKKVKK